MTMKKILEMRAKREDARLKAMAILSKSDAEEEAELIKTLAKFPEKVIGAMESYEPSIVTRYIIDVASAFNRFYHNCQILSADDADIKYTRVMLTKAANTVLGNAFELICMKKTEKI